MWEKLHTRISESEAIIWTIGAVLALSIFVLSTFNDRTLLQCLWIVALVIVYHMWRLHITIMRQHAMLRALIRRIDPPAHTQQSNHTRS